MGSEYWNVKDYLRIHGSGGSINPSTFNYDEIREYLAKDRRTFVRTKSDPKLGEIIMIQPDIIHDELDKYIDVCLDKERLTREQFQMETTLDSTTNIRTYTMITQTLNGWYDKLSKQLSDTINERIIQERGGEIDAIEIFEWKLERFNDLDHSLDLLSRYLHQPFSNRADWGEIMKDPDMYADFIISLRTMTMDVNLISLKKKFVAAFGSGARILISLIYRTRMRKLHIFFHKMFLNYLVSFNQDRTASRYINSIGNYMTANTNVTKYIKSIQVQKGIWGTLVRYSREYSAKYGVSPNIYSLLLAPNSVNDIGNNHSYMTFNRVKQKDESQIIFIDEDEELMDVSEESFVSNSPGYGKLTKEEWVSQLSAVNDLQDLKLPPGNYLSTVDIELAIAKQYDSLLSTASDHFPTLL
jgi:hypothetical protein